MNFMKKSALSVLGALCNINNFRLSLREGCALGHVDEIVRDLVFRFVQFFSCIPRGRPEFRHRC